MATHTEQYLASRRAAGDLVGPVEGSTEEVASPRWQPWIVWYAAVGLCETCATREEAVAFARSYRVSANPSNRYGGSVDVYHFSDGRWQRQED